MNDGVFKVVDILNGGNFIELNLDDFVTFDVATINVDSSNKFLNKLWENFNAKFSPKGKSHCPWAYLPGKYLINDITFTYFGSMRTSIGYIYAGVSYKKKGSIDKLHLFCPNNDINDSGFLPILSEIVNDALENNATSTSYYIHCEISCQFNKDNVLIDNYKGKKFIINNSKEKNNLIFHVQALNHTDAMNIALKK